MTVSEFNSLSIGDELTIGQGLKGTVTACYFQDGAFRIDLSLGHLECIHGFDASIIDMVTDVKPTVTNRP